MQAVPVYPSNGCQHEHVHLEFVREGKYFSANVLARVICDDCWAIVDEKRMTRSRTWSV